MALETGWWFNGAELGSTIEIDTYTGTAVSTTTGLRSGAIGSYCWQISNTSRISFDTNTYAGNGSVNVLVLWAKINSSDGSGFQVQSGTQSTSKSLRIAFNCSTGVITAYDGVNALLATSSGSAFPSDGTWFKVEWHYEYSTTSPLVSVFVDGTEVIAFTGSGNIATSSWLSFDNLTTADTLYIDDIVRGVDNTSTINEIDADIHVVAYRSNLAGVTPDFGGCSIESGENWHGMQDIPIGQFVATLTDAGGSATPNDYSGVITDDLGGKDNGGGPSGDTGASNTYSLLSHCYALYGDRTNGSSPTSYGLNYGKHNGSTYTNAGTITGATLTTNYAYYVRYVGSDATGAPTSSDYGALGGYHTDDGGRDIVISDFIYQTTLEVAATGNTLSADAGSYAVTGSAADFEVGMEADAGSYSVTGSAANFTLGKTLGVESGSYALTGEAADFLNGEVLSAEAGSYDVTGSAAEFPQGHVLPVDAGAYSYTGSAADLTFAQGSVTLDAESGSYTYTGSSADTLAHYVLETQVTGIETALCLDGSDGFKYWLNDANAIDGSTSTFAENDSEGYVYTSGEWTRENPVPRGSYAIEHFRLYGAIPPANAQANTISKVRYRIYCEVTGSGTPQLEVVVFDESAQERDASSWSLWTDLQRDHFVQTTAGWTDWTEVTPPVGGWATYDPATWPDPTKGLIRLEMAGQDPTGTMTLAKLYTAEVEYTYTDAVYTTSFVGIIDAADLNFAAESGSYSVTGSDADLILERKVLAESGSYSLTGSAAEFAVDWVLDAESGSYSYTGFAAAFQGDDSITANPGSYTYTGADAALKATLTFDAESGSYAYTGSDPNLILERKVLAESGAYTYSGVDVDLGLRYELDAESGAYAYTGTDADFTLIRKLLAEDSLYNIFFHQVKGDRHLLLPAEPGSYTTTGADVTFVEDDTLAAESGSYSYTGADASLVANLVNNYVLAANWALYSTGFPQIDLQRGVVLPAESGAYTLTGSDANLTAALASTLAANSGSYNVTGADANLESSIAPLSANAGSYSYSGSAANLKSVGIQGRRVIMIG